MKCPHCLVSFHENFASAHLGDVKREIYSTGYSFDVIHCYCPECKNKIIFLIKNSSNDVETRLIYPKSSTRPLPPEVPDEYASDFKEACNVLPESAKASAAISRRLLQHLLREKAGVKHSDLSKEIEEVIDSGKLPTHLAEGIDAVRNIGNFAAHPNKSNHTGEIIDVEPGEAEWLLDILEGLFDFYFVQPTILQKKRDALNQKLKEAGKPPMK